MNRYFGAPVLVLETAGRRSGKTHATPLIYLADGGRWIVLPANGGSDRTPSWWLNLQAVGRARVIVDGACHEVECRIAAGKERIRLWADFSIGYPSIDDYAAMTDRPLPLVILMPVGLPPSSAVAVDQR